MQQLIPNTKAALHCGQSVFLAEMVVQTSLAPRLTSAYLVHSPPPATFSRAQDLPRARGLRVRARVRVCGCWVSERTLQQAGGASSVQGEAGGRTGLG
jgi:hypothetical protein